MAHIRKVLSFDVGIINLAYCLLEINDNDKTFKILSWDIINLAADNRSICSYVKNNKKVCDKIAKCVVKINKNNCKYFCKAHVTKAELKVHNMDIKYSLINKPEVDLEKCNLCNKKGKYLINVINGQYCEIHRKTIMSNNGYLCAAKKCKNIVTKGILVEKSNDDDNNDNNEHEDNKHIEDNQNIEELPMMDPENIFEIGWCNDHFDENYNNYIKKKTKKMSQNSNVIPLSVLSESMFKNLDQIPELLKVDQVLIENQPALMNPTMKSIAAILFGYFILKGIHEKIKTCSTITEILFCCPANKIKVGGLAANNKLKNTNDDDIYKITKKLGVKYCKALISDNQEYLNKIESHKKQDDMADAFLQGFFKNFGPVMPVCYAEKITNVNMNDVNTVKSKKIIKTNTTSKKTVKSKIQDDQSIQLNLESNAEELNNNCVNLEKLIKKKPIKSIKPSDDSIDDNITIKIGKVSHSFTNNQKNKKY